MFQEKLEKMNLAPHGTPCTYVGIVDGCMWVKCLSSLVFHETSLSVHFHSILHTDWALLIQICQLFNELDIITNSAEFINQTTLSLIFDQFLPHRH